MIQHMNWKIIRLELGRTDEFPAGSVSRGYFVRVPLTDDGSVDEAAIERAPDKAIVRRFWSAEPEQTGRIVRNDSYWALRCEGKPDLLFPLRMPLRAVGEEVTGVADDGRLLPFRISSIRRFG